MTPNRLPGSSPTPLRRGTTYLRRVPAIEGSRPYSPGYGFIGSESGRLPWSWAEERLASARNYWIATVTPRYHPHLMPVWGVWVHDRFCFSASERSRRVRNLDVNPYVAVATDRADEGVVVEGTVAPMTRQDSPDLFAAYVMAYDPKYDWDIANQEGGHYVVAPTIAFAVLEHDSQLITRWRFRN